MPDAASNSKIKIVIEPRVRDIGGFSVRRALPFAKCRTVGPFIFFDHMGPSDFAPGEGIDVRPHPHVCLATVTYLFEGEIMHRDSLGIEQAIRPGDVNWMTAGRGIVHSERSGDEERARQSVLHGIQSWVALPKDDEEVEPSFFHHPKDTLPVTERDGVALRIIAGSAYGMTAPVKVFASMFYVDAHMAEASELELPMEYEERAIYVAGGDVEIDGAAYGEATMVVVNSGAEILIKARADSRLLLLGGAPLDGPRYLWWNFVSSDKARLERAKSDWKNGKFDPVPGETEFIPLPEDG